MSAPAIFKKIPEELFSNETINYIRERCRQILFDKFHLNIYHTEKLIHQVIYHLFSKRHLPLKHLIEEVIDFIVQHQSNDIIERTRNEKWSQAYIHSQKLQVPHAKQISPFVSIKLNNKRPNVPREYYFT
jgi:hypothetical protein